MLNGVSYIYILLRVGQMNVYPLTTIVTLALVILGYVLASGVSRARATYAETRQDSDMFHALEIYSDKHFMIAFRNHQNLSEHLVVMLPTLWICAFGVSDLVASVLGSFYFVGRVRYARNYPRNFSHRSGLLLSMFSLSALFLVAIGGVVYALIQRF